MKKFTKSNEENQINENKEEEKTLEEKLKEIIDETITVETDKDSDISESLEVEGKDDLLQCLLELYNEEKEHNISIIKEKLNTKYFHNLDIKDIDNRISKLQEQLNKNKK